MRQQYQLSQNINSKNFIAEQFLKGRQAVKCLGYVVQHGKKKK